MQTKEIKQALEEFFGKMGMPLSGVTVEIGQDAIALDVTSPNPEMLIGQNGQTLLELQRILKVLINKKFQTNMHLDVDINGYKKQKIQHLKNLAKNAANEVFLTRAKKILPPMPSYERRIIHAELAGRQDIITGSQGEGEQRRVVISPVI